MIDPLSKKDLGKAAPGGDYPGILQPDRFEDLQQLCSGSAIVPFPVGFEHGKQFISRRIAMACCKGCLCVIKAGLHVPACRGFLQGCKFTFVDSVARQFQRAPGLFDLRIGSDRRIGLGRR